MNSIRQLKFTDIGLLSFLAILMAISTAFLPDAIDWHLNFRPATLEFLAGRSPYDVTGIVSAPWLFVFLTPFAIVPENVGRAILFVFGLMAFLFSARVYGASFKATTLFMLSPPVIHVLLTGNIDWMILLSSAISPGLGVLFAILKPQLGMGLILFWLIMAWKKGGIRETLPIIIPSGIIVILSAMFYSPWPWNMIGFQNYASSWNTGIFPIGIPFGLTLMVWSINKNDIRYALAAGPFFSPYLNFGSWVAVFLLASHDDRMMFWMVVGFWMTIVVKAFAI